MKNKKEPAKKPYRSLFSNIIWSFKNQLKYAPLAFVLQLFLVPLKIALLYAAVYLPSLVVAEVTEGRTFMHAALSVGGLMLAMFIGNELSEFTGRLIGLYEQTYRYKVTYDLNHKSLGCFYQNFERKEMRDLLSRAQMATQMWDGVQTVTDLPKLAWRLVENVLSYILFGTVISFVSPWLIPILTIAPAVNWFFTRMYQKWEYANRANWTDTDRKLWYIANKPSDFVAAKDIRIYGMAGWFKEIYHDLTKEMAGWGKKRIVRRFLSGMADLLVIFLRDGAAYALLIVMTLNGEITVDKFVLYFAAISTFADRIGNIVNAWNRMHSVSLNICDLREYMEYPEYDGTGEADINDYLKGAPEITFDNVTFRYDGAEKDTLHNLSFTIKPGEKLALVGLNGAGKTTLVRLLCGLYKPTSGEIRINGTPVNKFYRRDYYKLFSPVFQEIKTAFFSLAETVSGRFGDEIDFERAEQCMRMAGLGEKLDALPQGIHSKLDKQVNKEGIELSGGEAQKLMLARALYKNAPMLVLDEPTAALDPIAESNIYKQYNEMAEGKSSLFISHRLASTRFCDRVFYMEDGVIKEEGTHEELVALGGKYSELYKLQSCWYKDDAKGGSSDEGI